MSPHTHLKLGPIGPMTYKCDQYVHCFVGTDLNEKESNWIQLLGCRVVTVYYRQVRLTLNFEPVDLSS